jgi:hypothetical protein
MTVDEIKQRREREVEVRAWYHQHTGRHIRSRNHLLRVMRDYALAKAVDAVLAEEDAESGR